MIKVYLKNGKEIVFVNARRSMREDGIVKFTDEDNSVQGLFVIQNIIGWTFNSKDEYVPVKELEKYTKEIHDLKLELEYRDEIIKELHEQIKCQPTT